MGKSQRVVNVEVINYILATGPEGVAYGVYSADTWSDELMTIHYLLADRKAGNDMSACCFLLDDMMPTPRITHVARISHFA